MPILPIPKIGSTVLSLQSDGSAHNVELTGICLRYLSYRNIWGSADSVDDDKSRRPFLNYAMKFWHLHKDMSGFKDLDFCRLAYKFFDMSNPGFQFWRVDFETDSAV